MTSMPQPSPAHSTPDTVKTAQILLVDDDPTVTRALANLLKRNGFTPVCFNTGHEAIGHITDSADPVAAVILDIHMPDVSGLVVSKRIRDILGPDVPIIMLSGDGSMQTLKALPHAGATHFFSKPIKTEQLLAYLRDLLPHVS